MTAGREGGEDEGRQGARPAPGNADAGEPPEAGDRESATPALPRLSLGTRILTFVVGWSLLLVGVAGLALPGIQGVLTILAGAAVLSVASETVYRLLRRVFVRWPKGMDMLERFRLRVHRWLHPSSSDESSD